MKNIFSVCLCVNEYMTVNGRQWHAQRCLITLSAVFLCLTIFCSSALAQNNELCSITGYVVDKQGNSVPGAFVELIMNGSIVNIADNPQITGDGLTKPFGSFNFTGLAHGNYMIEVEIMTPVIGKLNSSVPVNVTGDIVNKKVKLPSFVYVYSTPTPTPTPTATPQAVPEEEITITPGPSASESSTITGSGINSLFNNSTALLMIGMFSLIIVGGVGVFTISSRSGQKDRHTYNSITNKDDHTVDDPGSLPGAGAHQDMPGYNEDIACMVILKQEGNIADADYYQRVNAMAERYKIDQSKIMYDISKSMKVK